MDVWNDIGSLKIKMNYLLGSNYRRKDIKKYVFSYGYMFYIPVNLIYALIILFYGIKKNN